MTVSQVFAEDPLTDALLREATVHADAKQWDAAIACLQKAHARMETSPVCYPILTLLRLPLYLQKAGRFDEAMDEFSRIDQETPSRIDRHFGHQPMSVRTKLANGERRLIKDKMALAKGRETKRG